MPYANIDEAFLDYTTSSLSSTNTSGTADLRINQLEEMEVVQNGGAQELSYNQEDNITEEEYNRISNLDKWGPEHHDQKIHSEVFLNKECLGANCSGGLKQILECPNCRKQLKDLLYEPTIFSNLDASKIILGIASVIVIIAFYEILNLLFRRLRSSV